MSREQILINEIQTRLDELKSLFQTIPPTPTVEEPENFKFSDSILRMNDTVFKITPTQRIELCEFISRTEDKQINVKRFVEKIDPLRCNCYCLVKEIDRRNQFLKEGENLYYDGKKYYSQCRMPSIPNNNNYCNRHTTSEKIDISRMKILTNDTFNLTLDSIIKTYCMSYLPVEAAPTQPAPAKKEPVQPPTQAPVATQVAPSTKEPDTVSKKSPEVSPPIKKAQQKKAPPKKPAPKLKENSDIESSSGSDSEVDMIVSKVSESLKAPEDESGSEPEDSDDCMLDADEIHDEEGNTYYIDEAKSVIKLDEEGYGERLGMLKEFKSGNLFYKNKRWKIEYFPKK
jgi:hypothetical protein